uniref:Sulfotransferase domain-containing protein n=1 Tax=Odontella aurita TaxID=265563 RepID=A0A7S4HWU5_9STRA|mmetsp:Transcript_16325/g.47005  ORF Transcript_16325/g.47005 Transcript_16325/m.47005 type:complete len:365 (+) Transcript_16325:46-1140(+)
MRKRQRDVAATAIACLLVASAISSIIQANHTISAEQRNGIDDMRKPSARDVPKLTLPNVLLIGAQKGGSSALAAWLFDQGACRPKAFPGEPKSRSKEVHFFSNEQRYAKGIRFYARRFEHCGGKPLAMDATPNYLPYADRVKNVYDMAGGEQGDHLKIIMILREPVARELSLYNHKAKFYREDNVARISFWGDVVKKDGQLMTFGQFMARTVLRGVDPTTGTCKQPFHSYWWCFSLYSRPLRQWLDLFDNNQLLLLSYEELVRDEVMFRWRVQSFLGMNSTHALSRRIEPANTQNSKHKLSLPPCQIQSKLSTAFEKANEDLYELLSTKIEPSMEQHPFPKFVLSNCTAGKSIIKSGTAEEILL